MGLEFGLERREEEYMGGERFFFDFVLEGWL